MCTCIKVPDEPCYFFRQSIKCYPMYDCSLHLYIETVISQILRLIPERNPWPTLHIHIEALPGMCV
jgi:hypothetical protein